MTVAIIVIIAFYFLLFVLGYVFGKMDKKSNEVPTKPLEVKYVSRKLNHWKACQQVCEEDFRRMDSTVIERHVAGMLADKFKSEIQNHMIAEKDYQRKTVIYSIDVWLEGGN